MQSDLTKAVSSLQAMFHDFAKSKPAQQAIVAIENGDRSFRWVGTTGMTSSGEPVVKGTPFFIASIDKLFNATVAMLLAEDGKLDIERSICSYLPESTTAKLHVYRGKEYTSTITVRHLLTHTSGLADWLEDYPKGDSSLVEHLINTGDRAISVDELADHVRERLSPHFPPQNFAARRQKVRYSDTNFVLLVEIIEAVTGLPLHEVHRRMLQEPLALHQTYFPGHSHPLSPTLEPMMLRADGLPLNIPLIIQSTKGIYSTAEDLMAFARGLMTGKVFHKPHTLTVMMEHWRRFGFPTDKAALRAPNWPIEYSMGMMRLQIPRLLTPFSPLPAVVGHTGSTGCWLFYCPELDCLMSGTVEDVTAGAVPFRLVPKMLRILSKPIL